ncbi:hypothetical protein FLO80_21140 [Aquicoccus porphyridii]|uniref:Uncharacterized protein n=1 Tax=Aquicoccus porphyridii TaxID=1852029 RepID=A0A5A9YXG9_9RHOB|nr:hypothetical protein [Aquicoccus porphyridii]KAA0909537.1 hypothetical protein FLO80_21140 [Aquicoccus porphyridii]RAI51814.1 hypothetical protein DOO74_21245 [Rhodobacteraceae bacterium AsT-22]
MRSYEAARSLYRFLSFCAWCAIVGGGILAIAGLAQVSEMRSFGSRSSDLIIIMSTVPGLGIAFLGFIGLAIVQNGRATVDTAEYTQQMLQIARDQLEVSRQALRGPNAPAQSFAAAAKSDVPSDPPASRHPSKQQHAARTSEPKLKPSGQKTIHYRTKEIQVENGKYLYNGIAFDTRDKAERYIDAFAETDLPKPETS